MKRSVGAVLLRYAGVIAAIGVYFELVRRLVADQARGVHITKVMLGIVAASAYFYEQHCEGERRPISERWKKFVGVAIGVTSIILYFNGFKLGYAEWYHRHDQFHYYVGAKYFNELGYDRLYRCAAVAEDELGTVTNSNGRQVDLRKEVRHADRKIRDLGGTNLLIPAQEVLAEPEVCKSHFPPERWEKFKADIRFFRLESDKGYWEGMQKDHGFNPPPVWTMGGKFLAELGPASVRFQQVLGALDVVYVLAMFVALGWAFGWRVFAVAALLWGCEGAADPYFWTGGAFLRQDWLFYSVIALCFARKKYFALAGASLVYAALLRVFPGLMVVGWLVVAGAHLVRHRRLAPSHVRTLIGGTLAAAVLIGASVAYVGKDSYTAFYKHTIVVHDRTPLTNHMGLRVLIAHKPGTNYNSGRMKYTRDEKLIDPFQVWKDMRNARYDRYKWVGWIIIAGSLALFVNVVRRVKSLWIAQALSVIWVILLSQLTNYYYCFMVCAVPLIRVSRRLELLVYGYVIVSQVIWLTGYWNDDKYTMQTLVALMFSYALLAAFWPRSREQPAAKIGESTGPYREAGRQA